MYCAVMNFMHCTVSHTLLTIPWLVNQPISCLSVDDEDLLRNMLGNDPSGILNDIVVNDLMMSYAVVLCPR